MKALCFGSLNMDYTYRVAHFVSKGETLAADALNVFCGGKGLNQSIALARAGAAVYHAGAIGPDGQFLIRQLREAGVHTQDIQVLDQARTGHAVIQNDAQGDNCILLFGGANRMIRKEHVDQVLEHFQAGDFLVLQNEISQTAYLIQRGHEKGMKIALTPAPVTPDLAGFPLGEVDYLLLNRVEAAELTAQRGASDDVLAQALADRFPKTAIVLTLGEKGAVYRHGSSRFFQPAFPAKAVDTTAAGDTFAGFWIGAVMRGLSVADALRLAAMAAAISVTRPGASPSIPTLAEVQARLDLFSANCNEPHPRTGHERF